jgi:hypothetical protein
MPEDRRRLMFYYFNRAWYHAECPKRYEGITHVAYKHSPIGSQDCCCFQRWPNNIICTQCGATLERTNLTQKLNKITNTRIVYAMGEPKLLRWYSFVRVKVKNVLK